jgi:hypothetical protein
MPTSGILKGDLVLYKGVKYKVEFAGKTKFGFRAKLSYLNGTKEFWVNLSDLTPVESSSKEDFPEHILSLEESLLKPAIQAKSAKPILKPKKTPFDSGPPNPEEKSKKPVQVNPIYATSEQIKALSNLKVLKPELGEVEFEKLSYVEADKLLRSTLALL